jgi:hypothetical protein
MTGRPQFAVVLRAERHVAQPVRALRAALKALLRGFGLRCVAVTELNARIIRSPGISAIIRATAKIGERTCSKTTELRNVRRRWYIARRNPPPGRMKAAAAGS